MIWQVYEQRSAVQTELAFDKDKRDHHFGLSIDFTDSTPGVFTRPYCEISVAASFFSNDYMPTCQGLIDFVRIEPTDANLSRNKYSS